MRRIENKHGVTVTEWSCGCAIYSKTETGEIFSIDLCAQHLFDLLGDGDRELAAKRVTILANRDDK